MNIITTVIGYIQTNWADIVAIVTQVIGIASIVVRFTPTLKDDDVLKGIVRFLGKYVALNRPSSPNA